MFFEIGVLKVCNIHRKTPVLESLFSKVASLEVYKETPTQIFSCEYWELFKKILFKEQRRWLQYRILEIRWEFDYINREVDDICF